MEKLTHSMRYLVRIMYDIQFSNRAAKYIRKQDKNTRLRIRNSLLRLSENPYIKSNNDIKSLKGLEDIYRLRIGDFRVLYKVDEVKIIIFVMDIGSRGDIYKRL